MWDWTWTWPLVYHQLFRLPVGGGDVGSFYHVLQMDPLHCVYVLWTTEENMMLEYFRD
jgi:hypothetical protein